MEAFLRDREVTQVMVTNKVKQRLFEVIHQTAKTTLPQHGNLHKIRVGLVFLLADSTRWYNTVIT